MEYSGTISFRLSKLRRDLQGGGAWPIGDVSAEVERLRAATLAGTLAPAGEADIYDAAREESLWREYKVRGANSPARDNAAFTFERVVEAARPILSDCTDCVDFGALYALPDSMLAAEFPSVQFHAVDRSAEIKRLNEEEFGRTNLHFVAKDIFDFLEGQQFRSGLLVHSKVLMFLYPAFTARLYAAAKASGCRHVLCVEWAGYSHETGRFYHFDAARPLPSVLLRPPFFCHNYPWFARAAGYRIQAMQLYRSPMTKPHHRDAHLLVMRAEL
jgi:hypothetical protein